MRDMMEPISDATMSSKNGPSVPRIPGFLLSYRTYSKSPFVPAIYSARAMPSNSAATRCTGSWRNRPPSRPYISSRLPISSMPMAA